METSCPCSSKADRPATSECQRISSTEAWNIHGRGRASIAGAADTQLRCTASAWYPTGGHHPPEWDAAAGIAHERSPPPLSCILQRQVRFHVSMCRGGSLMASASSRHMGLHKTPDSHGWTRAARQAYWASSRLETAPPRSGGQCGGAPPQAIRGHARNGASETRRANALRDLLHTVLLARKALLPVES
jgi:hypothetical protein